MTSVGTVNFASDGRRSRWNMSAISIDNPVSTGVRRARSISSADSAGVSGFLNTACSIPAVYSRGCSR